MGMTPTDSTDRCPEWQCPDLSTHDRREGKTCPDHPCTCEEGRRPVFWGHPAVTPGFASTRAPLPEGWTP